MIVDVNVELFILFVSTLLFLVHEKKTQKKHTPKFTLVILSAVLYI